MNVSLTPELEKFVTETVASGRFRSASEVVRNSLRIMEEEERWKTYARAKIAKGLEDVEAGRVVDGEAGFKRLRKLASEKEQKARMKAFQLSKDSLRDLEEAIVYLAEDSERAAHNLVDDLETGFHFLAQWPLSGHLRTDLTHSPLRFWTVAGFLIAYRPQPKPLTIVAVLHGSRDAAAILRDRRA